MIQSQSQAAVESPQGRPNYKWELLALLWVANFLNQGDRQIFNAVLPLIKSGLGATDVQMGLVASIFSLAFGLMIPIAGWLGDGHSRKWIVCGSLLVFSAGTLCTGLATGLISLIVFRSIATGVGESFYTPSALSLIGEHHHKTRGFALSLNQTAQYVGIVLSSWLAAWIGAHYGWRATFLVFGSMGLLLVIALALRVRDSRPAQSAASGEAPRVGEILGVVKRKPTVILLTVAFSLLVFGHIGFVTWMPTLIFEKFSVSLTEAAFHSVFLHFLFAFVGVLVGGWVSDKWAVRTPKARIAICAFGLFGCAPFVYMLGVSDSLLVVNLALGAFGFFRGLYDSNQFASLYEVVPARYRSSLTGFMIALAYGVGAAAPVCLGWVKERASLSAGMMFLAPVFFLGGLVLVLTAVTCFNRDRVEQQD